MDIRSVRVSQEEIDIVLARTMPAAPAVATADPCTLYRNNRHYLQIALALLSVWFPPGAAALAAMIAIIEKACDGTNREQE